MFKINNIILICLLIFNCFVNADNKNVNKLEKLKNVECMDLEKFSHLNFTVSDSIIENYKINLNNNCHKYPLITIKYNEKEYNDGRQYLFFYNDGCPILAHYCKNVDEVLSTYQTGIVFSDEEIERACEMIEECKLLPSSKVSMEKYQSEINSSAVSTVKINLMLLIIFSIFFQLLF